MINYQSLLLSLTLIIFNPLNSHANPQCETRLRSGVQWNHNGDKSWKPQYIAQLCNGSVGLEAVHCFEHVWRMPGNDWKTGVRACAGSRNRKLSIANMHRQAPSGMPRSAVARTTTSATPSYAIEFIGVQIGPCKDSTKPWDGMSSKGCDNITKLSAGAATATALGYAFPGVAPALAVLAIGNAFISKAPEVYGYVNTNGQKVTLISRGSAIRGFNIVRNASIGTLNPGGSIQFYFFDKDPLDDDPMNAFSISYNEVKPGTNTIYVGDRTGGQVVNIQISVR